MLRYRTIVADARGMLLGMAVQVDLMKSMLKAPGTKRLKLNSDQLLSNVTFQVKLRRYTSAAVAQAAAGAAPPVAAPALARARGVTPVMWSRGVLRSR